jgi:hypothetical protein
MALYARMGLIYQGNQSKKMRTGACHARSVNWTAFSWQREREAIIMELLLRKKDGERKKS